MTEKYTGTALQRAILNWVRDAGHGGVTVAELRDMGLGHHGTVSGALSLLNRKGKIEMLDIKRDGCHVYVLPAHRAGRDLYVRRKSYTTGLPNVVGVTELLGYYIVKFEDGSHVNVSKLISQGGSLADATADAERRLAALRYFTRGTLT